MLNISVLESHSLIVMIKARFPKDGDEQKLMNYLHDRTPKEILQTFMDGMLHNNWFWHSLDGNFETASYWRK